MEGWRSYNGRIKLDEWSTIPRWQGGGLRRGMGGTAEMLRTMAVPDRRWMRARSERGVSRTEVELR